MRKCPIARLWRESMRRFAVMRRIQIPFVAAVLIGGSSVLGEEPEPVPGIPGPKVGALQNELREAGRAASSARKRRAYKNLVRDGESLLEASPAAGNRWQVLEIIFQSQKRLLGLENESRNRKALFETCAKLAEAPDEFADLRLEADMLLSERELAGRNADVTERTEALARLIARYRDTPGEAKCLMMAALIAPKLEAFDLEKEIDRTLGERFAGDLDVIEWRRKHRDFSHLPVQFAGTFARSDGTELSFPVDRMGHTCVMFFWSQETPEIGGHFDELKDLQARFPGQFEVYSINLDELADAGASVLRRRGLDWTALKLPGGRRSQVYRAYAQQDPLAIRVNAHGHAFISASQTRIIAEEAPMEQNFDDLRYHAQFQSLLVGEFLVAGTDTATKSEGPAGSVPREALEAIQACFVPPPLRYRLTSAEARENYERAERLCREVIGRHPKAPELWRVRNCRIIALLGLWNVGAEPGQLEAAVEEARTVLREALPSGAGLVARFCLAKHALRGSDSNRRASLTDWIESVGGERASATALAAAAILALDANARELHDRFRERVLAAHDGEPGLWPVVSFLVDQNHRYRLFKPNFYHPPSKARRIERARLRGNAAGFDVPEDALGPLKAEFATLDGETLRLPQATDGKLTLLMFVEPPAGSGTDWPTLINGAVGEDARGRKIETTGVMQHAFRFADQHVRQGIRVIAAFLSEDPDRVRALVEAHQWPCQAVLVPGGLTNPLVGRLGILSADRVPNIVLLRPEGAIAWKLSGIVHPQVRSEGIHETLHVISRAMKSRLDAFEMEKSLRVFEAGEWREAIQLFGGWTPPPERPSPDEWAAPRLHGRALAQIKLENWEGALSDLDSAIEAHQWVFNARKQCVCERVAQLQLARATVLEKLGKEAEAAEARKRAAAAKTSHGPSRSERLHERLERSSPEGDM